MASLNKVMIIGRLGRDPKMRHTSAGTPMTSFSVAAGRTWKTSDGNPRTETEWFNIVAWGSLAEICSQYLSKGQRVYIEGRLQSRTWEDASGAKKAKVEVIAKEMIMLDRSASPDDVPENEIENYDDLDEDEIPF